MSESVQLVRDTAFWPSVAAVAPEVYESCEFLSYTTVADVVAFRERQCAWLVELAEKTKNEWLHDMQSEERNATSHIRSRFNPVLFRTLLEKFEYDDVEAADILSTGAQVSGVLPGRKSWSPGDSDEDVWSVEDLVRWNRRKLPEMCARAIAHAKKDENGENRKILSATLDDVKSGISEGPYSLLDFLAAFPGAALSKRFPVVQEDKTRPCDDAKESGINNVTCTKYKLKLNTIISFVAAFLAVGKACGSPPLMWKRDHKSAYKQIPIRIEDIPLCSIFCADLEGKVQCFRNFTLPFGLTAAVNEYNRVSQAVTFLHCKIFKCVTLGYFDDFCGAEQAATSQSAFDTFQLLNSLIGLQIKTEKDVVPMPEIDLIGYGLKSSRGVGGDVEITVKITEKRREKLDKELRWSSAQKVVSTKYAEKLAGQLNFGLGGLHGKAGRAFLQPIYVAAAGGPRSPRPGTLLRDSLMKLRSLLQNPVPKVFNDYTKPPTLIYVDACGGSRPHLGAVRVDCNGIQYCTVKCVKQFRKVLRKVRTKSGKRTKNPIAYLELAAAIVGLRTFVKSGEKVIMLCDNKVQTSVLRKNYSSHVLLGTVGNVFWTECIKKRVDPIIVWIPSKANIADEASRPWDGCVELGKLNAVKVEAKSPNKMFKALSKQKVACRWQ